RVVLQLAEVRATQERWADAARYYSQAIDQRNGWLAGALAYLKAGDTAGYQRYRARLREVSRPTLRTLEAANEIAWISALGPGEPPDAVALIERLREEVAKLPADQGDLRHIVLNTLGALLYRSGKPEEAIACLKQGIEQVRGRSQPQDWIFLALAH